MEEELIEILITLAEIVEGLSDDPDFSGGWHAAEVVSRLKALRRNKDEYIDQDRQLRHKREAGWEERDK